MTGIVPASDFATAAAVTAKINELGPRLIDAERLGRQEQADFVREAETLLAAVSAASEAIARAQRPATAKEIAVNLGMLLKAFPNSGRDDIRAFGDMLIADVRDEGPSIAAVVRGCAKLRRTSKFLPTIAEVLEAIREVDDGIRAARLRLETMPARMAELKRAVEEGRRDQRPGEGA